MNEYDQTARYAAKNLDAEGYVAWLVPTAVAEWSFRGWLDTRTLPFPGEPDRICDTVAHFERRDGTGPAVALVIEFKSRPEGSSPEQLAEYVIRLRREIPTGRTPPEAYAVLGVLVNLTGPARAAVWEMTVGGFGGAGLRFQVVLRTLREESAAATLAAIAQGTVSRAILAWIPLMQGADESAIIEEWKRLAGQEPDGRKRADYGGLALVFAELAGRTSAWQQALEGWNMEQSLIVLEWQEKRERTVQQRNILLVLQRRFGAEIPADIRERVTAQVDLTLLQQWLVQASAAVSLDGFRAALQPGANGVPS